jgi:2-C-methyl-D-erythritol 4-phosphate cytidylyltransferase
MSDLRSVGCVVVAAGSGARLGADRPKAFVELAGTALLKHAVDRVRASGAVGHVVVVVPQQWLAPANELVGGGAAGGSTSDVAVTVVAGGAERQDSVAAGLAELPDDVDVVLVHDAARCLAPPTLVARVVEAVRRGHPAVVPGLPVTDTIKRVRRGSGDTDDVQETVDRDQLRIAQTPQGFERAVLESAHAAASDVTARTLTPAMDRLGAAGSAAALAPLYTDDAEMAELVTDVVVVPGDPLAFKVTTAQDLAHAQWLLARGPDPRT